MTTPTLDDRFEDLLVTAHRSLSAGDDNQLVAVVDHPTQRQPDGRPRLHLTAPWPLSVDRINTGFGAEVILLVHWYAAAIRAEAGRRPWPGRLHGLLVARTDAAIPDDPAGLFDPELLPPPICTCELYLLDGIVASVAGQRGHDAVGPVETVRFEDIDNVEELFAPDNWLAPVIAAIRGTDVPEGRIRAFADHLGITHRRLSLGETTEAILEHTLDRQPPADADGYIGPVGARIPAAAWTVLDSFVYHPYDLDRFLAGDAHAGR